VKGKEGSSLSGKSYQFERQGGKGKRFTYPMSTEGAQSPVDRSKGVTRGKKSGRILIMGRKKRYKKEGGYKVTISPTCQSLPLEKKRKWFSCRGHIQRPQRTQEGEGCGVLVNP